MASIGRNHHDHANLHQPQAVSLHGLGSNTQAVTAHALESDRSAGRGDADSLFEHPAPTLAILTNRRAAYRPRARAARTAGYDSTNTTRPTATATAARGYS